MKSHWIAFPALLLGAVLAHAQSPPSADSLLDQAKTQAAPDHRAIFAIFHASWCGWCRKLDSFLESAEIKPVVDKYFVTVHFTVQESADKKALENPGGDEFMKAVGGPAGLPFFAFLDSKGALIVNSLRPGEAGKSPENIGHPDKPEEVDWFMTMVNKAAPRMTREEAGTLEKYLRNQKK
jgi:thiol-disulfide isomerase/thioredoxin